ncbi:MAG: TIM-barrel domain-containing protein [Flavobacteriaceae bacterium]
MKKIVFGLLILIFALTGCATKFSHKIEKTSNGATIYLDSLTVQVEVVNKAIIHIKKYKGTPTDSTIPDYVTVLKPQDTAWDLKEEAEHVTLSTDDVVVKISNTGVIRYMTKEEDTIVSETNDLTYIKPNKGDGNAVSQAFLAGEEAIYGLGQFQSGVINWKNMPIRLQQDNQEIAIPFIVSTKNYGIYWHNYSITDFNVTENEVLFTTTIDEEKKIRETTFTPDKTGVYTFMVESNSQNKRGKNCEIRVAIEDDNIVDYTVFWAPVCYSGQKYLEAGKPYKITFQNTNSLEMGRLFYNEPDYNKTVFSSKFGNTIDYYFVHGENPGQIVSEYQGLTGKVPMFPKSAYGFWQCRERYHNQEELLENAREYRKREIPVDNIVQDWFYWPEGTKGPEWDSNKYPNPKAMIDELDSLNLQLMVSVWPEVINDPLLKKYDLDQHKLEGTDFLDFTNKGVQERYYGMLKDSMLNIGVSSIWLDGSEPESRPDDNFQTSVGPFGDVANCYSLLVTKSMYEGMRQDYPDKRVFNLTRSAYAGQQRYGAASWSGDVSGTWKQFSEQIPAGLNFVMAGVPYWTTDIGGFFRDSNSLNPIYDSQYTNTEYIELLTRWFQYGTFTPLFRIHGYVSETEIWRYGQEFEETARKFIDLRYQLMPYIYSEAWKVTKEGKLLMSPLSYYYPKDSSTWEIKDQFFFGESLLVGAVTKYGERSKEVYLPEGRWYNYWTSEKVTGKRQVTVNAPLDETPLFVKEGTILPLGPKVQYTSQPTEKPLTLKVYTGKDAEYTLYLDDNESYAYEQGVYTEIIINYTESNQEISIKNGSGTYIDFNQNPMHFIIEKVGMEKEEKVIFNGNKVQVQL